MGPYHRRKRKGRRARLPDSLTRVPVYYDILEAEKVCPCGCGRQLRRVGERITEELVVIAEVSYVRQHIRPVYGGCLYDSHIITTPMLPALIKKGLASPEIVAYTGINKYQDHLPLYRQEKRFKRSGIEISRQTLCDWLQQGYEHTTPLLALIKRETLRNPIVHTDDTPVQVQVPGNQKTKQGRLWVYAGRGGEGDIHSYIFYDYSPDRQAKWPQTRLSGYAGYIQADAYSGYDCLFKTDENKTAKLSDQDAVMGQATEVACWMHTRRNFYNIAKNNKKRGLAYHAVQVIKQLYDIEVPGKALDPLERCQLRQKKSIPILNAFKIWLDEQHKVVMPKTPLADAINYALNQWEALCRYTQDGRLEIDNGYAERLIKPTCIGKKNFLFFGSDAGGHMAAGYYTLIQSALLYDLNPQDYLTDILRRLPGKLYHTLEDLLPHRWKPFNPYDEKSQNKDTPIIVANIMDIFKQPP